MQAINTVNRSHEITKENVKHSTMLHPFSYYCCEMPARYDVPLHWHEEFEINLVVDGEGEIACHDQRYQVRAGDLFLIAPNTLHGAFPAKNSPLVYEAFVFHHRMLGTGSNDHSSSECILPIVNGDHRPVSHIPQDHPQYVKLAACAREILDEAKADGPVHDLMLKSCLLRFFYLMECDGTLVEKDSPNQNLMRLVHPALEYMEVHYGEDLTIEQLAEQANLSQSYFMGCFKKAAGIGAIEYLTQIRMQHAREMLAGSSRSVAEIAAASGYGNLSNFNRHFKRVVGCTPREYRKRQ